MGIAEQVMEKLMGTPMGQKVRKEVAVAAFAERQDLADQIKAITVQRGRELPPLKSALDKAEVAVESARLLLKEKAQAHRGAYSAYHGTHRTFESQGNRLRGQLRASAPVEIEAFLADLRDLDDELRDALAASREEHPDGRITLYSNKGSVDARRAAIRRARDEAVALQEAAVRDVVAAIGSIRKTIPPVGPQVRTGEERAWNP